MAGYNRAVGMPNYSSSSGGYFIPELWAPRIQVKFYAKSAFREISNTMYEGDIKKFGDVVNIRTYPSITIGNYVKGQALDIQVPSSTPTSLTINKGKYFNVLVDDVDEAQSDINLLDEFAKAAGEDIAVAIDRDVLQNVYSSADTDNVGTTAGVSSGGFDLGESTDPVLLTKVNILDTIVDANSVLDEQNVPDDERWIVLPPIFTNLISKSDLKDCSMTGDKESIIRNGKIGKIDNMTIYMSNNLYSVTDGTTSNTCWYCLFGHPIAISFAEQLVETYIERANNTFGKFLRGLHVYGYDVTKAEGLGYIYAEKG